MQVPIKIVVLTAYILAGLFNRPRVVGLVYKCSTGASTSCRTHHAWSGRDALK